ncbi:hypothetical protein [Streptomyces sp. NPDC101393]|uniref:hypothetical protein n=1 Tax=Streptomyces sp. NPDC101393 TaxID=3366141 RepID=UPI00381CCFEF
MSKFVLTSDVVSAAQTGDQDALARVFDAVKPMVRSIAGEFAGSDYSAREELEAEANLSVMANLAGYTVGSRASLTTYLHPRVVQDVRNAHFGARYSGAIDGEAASRYARAAGQVHAEIREERNAGRDEVRDGEVHDRIKTKLMNLDHGLAWSAEKFLAVHDLAFGGTESLDAEDENGEARGSALADLMSVSEESADVREVVRSVRKAKTAMVEELMAALNDNQSAVIALSFGIGMHRDQFVAGVVTGSYEKMDTRLSEELGLTADVMTDLDVAELLGTSRANVRKLRERALSKMRGLVGDRSYPTSQTVLTFEEREVQHAIATNDEGTYVQVWEGRVGKSMTKIVRDAEFHLFNEEGDRVVIAMGLERAIGLGLLEGENSAQTFETPESYDFLRLYGNGIVPLERRGDVYDECNQSVVGADRGAGDREVTVRQGDPILPIEGTDYGQPAWDVPALRRTDFLARRSYSASH